MIKDMTQGNEAKHIIVFTIPMLIGNVFQQLYNMVDMAVVGKYVGSNALAAVGVGFPIMFIMISAAMGLAMGGGIVISQLYGAKRMEDVRRANSTMIIFGLVCSLIITVIGYFSCDWLLRIMHTPQEIIQDAAVYLKIIFLGMLFLFMYNVYSTLFVHWVIPKHPYFLIISALLNVVLDILFVAGFNMGVAGAAWATIISQGVSAVLCVLYIYIKNISILKLHRHEFVFDRPFFGKAMKLGIPSALQQTVLSMGFMFIQSLVNSFGSITVAAISAATRIEQIATMPAMNIGMAVSTFTGQNIGAGHIDRVKRGFVKTLIMVCGVTIVLSAVVLISGPYLLQIFIKATDVDVIRQGTQYLQVVCYFLIVFSVMFTANGVLRGAGDVNVSAISTVATLGVRLIAGYAMKAWGWGPASIWWSLPVGWAVGVSIALIRYAMGTWRRKAVVHAIPYPSVITDDESTIMIMESPDIPPSQET